MTLTFSAIISEIQNIQKKQLHDKTSYSFDVDLVPMTLAPKLDSNIVQMYLHTQNKGHRQTYYVDMTEIITYRHMWMVIIQTAAYQYDTIGNKVCSHCSKRFCVIELYSQTN